MASLLSWVGNVAKRVENTVNNDVIKPVKRDVVQPIARATPAIAQAALPAPVQIASDVVHSAPPILRALPKPIQAPALGFMKTDKSIVNAPSNIVKLASADFTHNQPARQNAITALKPAVQAAQGFTRPIPEAITTVTHPFRQATYTPGSRAEKAIFGKTQVQNIQANVAHNYDTHSHLPAPARIGLAGLDALGQAAQVIPVAGAAGKIAKTGVDAIKAADITDAAKTVKQATSLTPRTTANEQMTLQDLSNHYSGANPLKPAALSKTITQARVIATKHGVNLATGSPAQKLDNINSILDKVKTENRAVSQGGFARVPGGKPSEDNIGKPPQTPDINKSASSNASIPAPKPPSFVPSIRQPSASSLDDTARLPKSASLQARRLPQKANQAKGVNVSLPNDATKALPGQVKTIDKIMANTVGTTPEQEATKRLTAQAKAASKVTKGDQQAAHILNTKPETAMQARTSGLLPEENETVSGPLSVKPSPKSELPPTPAYNGDLVPMQTVPTANKLFSSKVNVIRKINTPSAHALADLVQETDKAKEGMRAYYMSKIPTVQKLSNKETAQMFDLVEKKIEPKDVSSKIAKAAKEWTNLTPQIYHNGFQEGAIIGNRDNYVPHNYPKNFFTKQKGSVYDSALQHLMDTKQVDHQQAVSMFKDLARQNAERANWFGNFENARLTDMPGYQKTQEALGRYIEGAANRTAEAHYLGLDNQRANKLLQNIRMEGGDAPAAVKAMEGYLRSPVPGNIGKASANARGFLGAAQLGKAVISHAGQTSNTAVDAGITRTAQGWAKYLARSKGNSDFIRKTGVSNPQVIHGYRDQYTSVKGVLSKITAPGLTQMMKINRGVTALAYREYGNSLASKGSVDELRKLGVTGNVGKRLTDTQELQVARGGVNRTMFGPSRADTPTYAETTTGKLVGQYRTAYAYKQTGFIYDRVINEAKNGNLKPLTRFLAVSAPVGYGTVAIKNKISGNKEGPGGVAMDAGGALGGIPGEAALELFRYGKRDLPGAVAGEVAPALGTAYTTTNNLQSALSGELAPVGRQALGLVPIVGSRISKTALPSTTAAKPNSLTVSQQAKLAKAGVNSDYATNPKFKPNITSSGNSTSPTQRELDALSPNASIRWNNMTTVAKKNYAKNNPTDYLTRETAQINSDASAGKISQPKAISEIKTAHKTAVSSQYTQTVQDLYGQSKADIVSFLNTQPNKQALTSQLFALDNDLYNSGLITSKKFKYGLTSTKSSGGSSGTKASTLYTETLKNQIAYKAPKAPKISKVKYASNSKYKAPSVKKFTTPKLAVTPKVTKHKSLA